MIPKLQSPDFSLPNTVREARKIIYAARVEATQVLDQAKQDAQRIALEARLTAEQKVRDQASSLLLELQKAKQKILKNAQSELLKIVSLVAEEVVGTALTEQPESIRSRIARAIEHCLNAQRIMIYVNPRDLAVIQKGLLKLSCKVESSDVLQLCADEHVSPGDARLEADSTIIDLNTREHLQRLLRELFVCERI